MYKRRIKMIDRQNLTFTNCNELLNIHLITIHGIKMPQKLWLR